jgi:hypothetical protein
MFAFTNIAWVLALVLSVCVIGLAFYVGLAIAASMLAAGHNSPKKGTKC